MVAPHLDAEAESIGVQRRRSTPTTVRTPSRPCPVRRRCWRACRRTAGPSPPAPSAAWPSSGWSIAACRCPRRWSRSMTSSTASPRPTRTCGQRSCLGVDPTRCLVVEDAPAGVQAAKAAGATVLALRTTHGPSDLGLADHHTQRAAHRQRAPRRVTRSWSAGSRQRTELSAQPQHGGRARRQAAAPATGPSRHARVRHYLRYSRAISRLRNLPAPAGPSTRRPRR